MTEYIASGGNRHPAVADWHQDILAYGSDRNIAIWKPQAKQYGVEALLVGHTDTVNAVKFFPSSNGLFLISGSVDKSIRLWSSSNTPNSASGTFECVQVLSAHSNSVNSIAVIPQASIFVTGSADAQVKVWKLNSSVDGSGAVKLVQTIEVKPRHFPLALAVGALNDTSTSLILAVGGTSTIIQLFVTEIVTENETNFRQAAVLSGHEGWIRSLSFIPETDKPNSDLLLSSASQDKYIRLWRVHEGKDLPPAAASSSDSALGAFLPGKSLSNKAHRFRSENKDYSATFEALLLGHEDWIYSANWFKHGDNLQLLSASADNSLAIWQQDSTSGIWITLARLGEISAEKGSTTATGSTGGFWTGLWSPDGNTVVCLGRTGSWRLWSFDKTQDRWIQGNGVSGHIQAVTGIAWSVKGDYLLSTSSDQTTRLHAQITLHDQKSWHEMCRPQIHGYDLNCIGTLGDSSFVSGADEKLLRVFKEPKAVADLLQRVCGIEASDTRNMPDAANIPVLGLSNKAVDAVNDDEEPRANNEADRGAMEPGSIPHKSTLNMDHPPFEDQLSRYTLWPEIEKLYGHGYEISTLATNHDGSIIATACKASSIDHAVIRLFETNDWHEIKPPLIAHSLTVTRLRFSADDRYLLSVGRDRQWALFQRAGDTGTQRLVYQLNQSNPKGHTRMILDAAWVSGSRQAFATAGRDKQVKIWAQDVEDEGDFKHKTTISEELSVTAIDFIDTVSNSDLTYLAVGTESGKLTVYHVSLKEFSVLGIYPIEARNCPSKAITQLSWRPAKNSIERGKDDAKIAVASEDCSLRIFTLKSLIPASD